MQVFLVLGSSSSSSTSITNPPPQHHHNSTKPCKTSIPKVSPSRTSSPPSSSAISTVHSRAPLLSDVRLNFASSRRTDLSYNADLASKLAERGKLEDFAMVVESVVVSGVEASQFASALSVDLVARGISRCIREGKVWSVIQALRKCNELGVAPLKLFDRSAVESLRRDCLRIARCGEVDELVDLMEILAGFGFTVKELMKPSDIIKICIDHRNPKLAVRYACILPHSNILFCNIINDFGKKGNLDSALIAFEESKPKLEGPNMYIYRSIIDVCGLCGDYMKSRYIYEDLLTQKVTPNIYVFNSLMNVNSRDLNYTFQLYQNMQNVGVSADMASYNILLKACCLARRVDLAQEIYREVKHLESTAAVKMDVFTYSTIVKVFADAKLWQLALKVKEDMESAGVTPNTVTWSSIISACANAGLVELSIRLFEEMIKAGCEPNSQCCNILLHACVEACQYDRAFRLFRAWKNDRLAKSTESFPSLYLSKEFAFKPTITTYNILLKACGTDYYHARALMEEMKTVGLVPNYISWSILIDIWGGSGNVEGAVQILKTMRMDGIAPDVVAYTTAIKVCVESKNWKLASSLFEEMKRFQIKPNLVTYSTLLRARSSYGSLHEVQQCLAIYQDMRKAGFKSNDHYLKEVIEEWCEGVLHDNNQQQRVFSSSNKRDIAQPPSLLLEKVAEHLQKSFSESLAIDLQGLTKVEARIVVLAVLRMIKENYSLGQIVKDDLFIILGAIKANAESTKHRSEIKDVIIKLLRDELGIEILPVAPIIAEPHKVLDSECSQEFHTSLQVIEGTNESSEELSYSTRRPTAVQRLKVTRRSLNHWLRRSR